MRSHSGAVSRLFSNLVLSSTLIGLAACDARSGGGSGPLARIADKAGLAMRTATLDRLGPNGSPAASATPTPMVTPEPTGLPHGTGASIRIDVPLYVEEYAGVGRVGEPVRSGVPMPRSAQLYSTDSLIVTGPDGARTGAQFRVTSRWGGAPDDSSKPVKWLLVDFAATVPSGDSRTFHLQVLEAPATPTSGTLIADDSAARIQVKTGAATFSISKTRFNLFDRVDLADGTTMVGSDPNAGIYLTLPDGTRFLAAAGTTGVSVEENGPLHAVIVARGKHATAAGARLLDWEVRMHFYRDRPDCLVSYTFTDRDLAHIGDFSAIDELGITTPVKPSGTVKFTFGGEASDVSGTLLTAASQRQTGGLDPAMGSKFNPGAWDTLRYTDAGAAIGSGNKAPGWMDVSGANGGVTSAVKWFWQQYPKKLAVTPGSLQVALWPAEEASMRVYAGASKTHEILYTFHDAATVATASGHSLAARVAEPLFARAAPAWYARSWAWNRIGVASLDAYPPEHQALVDKYFANIEGVEFPATFITRRNGSTKGHAYSMWDFGDGRENDWSNLAYDTPRSLMIFWAITGDRAFFDRGIESATHMRDIDIEHSPLDTRAGIRSNRGVAKPWLGRSRYNPCLGPQAHDLGSAGATGYGFEHSKGQGLADHYFLTGDMLSKEVLAETYHYYEQWKVDADSGYHRTDGSRVVSHMLNIILGYYDAYGTAEAKSRADFVVSFLNDWQRRRTTNDPNGWMWMTSGDGTAAFMNGVTAESLMLYEVMFPDGVAVKQNLIDAATFTVDPSKNLLVNGAQGHYFNAWSGENYGVSHATVLDPMTTPLLGYAWGATGTANFLNLSKEVLQNSITQDQSTPYVKSYTEQTRVVPAFLYFLQTPEQKREGTINLNAPASTVIDKSIAITP